MDSRVWVFELLNGISGNGAPARWRRQMPGLRQPITGLAKARRSVPVTPVSIKPHLTNDCLSSTNVN
jgi:hypothetical protein